jgi:hypothetical protein
MYTNLISSNENTAIIQITVPLGNQMLEGESLIQDALNEAGNIATGELLKKFDTNGAPIVIGNTVLTSKGKVTKQYQTPYGMMELDRYVYQSSQGGATFCPLDQDARIIVSSTPRFSKQICHKFAEMASTQVSKDLSENHNRDVARSYLQNVADAVGSIVIAKEESWNYVPSVDKKVYSINIGIDGTCMLMCEDGYRETMVGTISLHDKQGERLHTTYIAASPEYGKHRFKEHFELEISRIKKQYHKATVIGIADGAKTNWDFLTQHTEHQILDFWHVTEYLGKVAEAVFPKDRVARNEWMDDRCHRLKHKNGMASRLITELEGFEQLKLSDVGRDNVVAAINYFKNNNTAGRMNYAQHVAANHSIGSGVTEAACKVIVKQRLCKSGMKWKDHGSSIVLSLRTLVHSGNYWSQFWNKVSHYGFPVAA